MSVHALDTAAITFPSRSRRQIPAARILNSQLEGNLQWQAPFGLFFIIPAILASCIWRLLVQGREEEAVKALRRLRAGCFTEEEMDQELDALRIILAEETEKGTWFDLFRMGEP
ncbi:hypothetical protein DL767_008561 [Monosporascus sp. MG133]|nr:hypothetical protein DL767_008561 [Monosporascus sp. MG133]